MDACQAVDAELERIFAKFETAQRNNDKHIDETLRQLAEVKQAISLQQGFSLLEDSAVHMNSTLSLLVRQAAKIAKDTAAKVSQQHKDLHASVSRLGRVIDKVFIQEFNVINCPEALHGKEQLEKLSQAIIQHLYRQGLLEAGLKLAQEAGLEVDEAKSAPFVELNAILISLHDHNVGPALEWAVAHRAELDQRHSNLEYKLHRLQFIELIKRDPQDHPAILEYSRKFQTFRSSEQIKDVQRLMGSLLFLKFGIERSPYRDLMSQDLWVDVSETFTKEACALLGLSVESPLTVCVKMGCRAIPMLLNIRTAMMQHQVGEIWNCSKQELPIEVDVTPDYLYHSRFSCPILRQQSTDKNPPVRLNCGHVISKDALQRLATSTKSSKIKCPYCPSEQTPADAKRIYL